MPVVTLTVIFGKHQEIVEIVNLTGVSSLRCEFALNHLNPRRDRKLEAVVRNWAILLLLAEAVLGY